MTVTRSLNHISTQVISPEGKFISSASTKDKSFLAQTKGKKLTKKEKASLIGNIIAKRIQEKGLSEICFDRSGYLYHGRIKALAEGAREAGLKF